MKERLIILNYQRSMPPFIEVLISNLDDKYREIIYVTPKQKDDSINCLNNCSIFKHYEISQRFWWMHLPFIPFKLLRQEVIKDIVKSFKIKKINLNYFKYLITMIHCSALLENQVRKIFKDEKYNPEDVTILATWFHVEAYAAARLKKKLQNYKSVSFAHAFEVDPTRNHYVDLKFNNYLHCHLDNINFIAREKYKKYTDLLKLNESDSFKITQLYFGTNNSSDIKTRCSIDKTLRIVSCSYIESIKRVNLIAEAIKDWNICPIEWVHIGDGSQKKDLFKKCEKIMFENKMVNIQLIGKLDNSEVHTFYRQNYIDLFISVSETEGLPVSFMEAMSYGIPIIATDVGGNNEILVDGVNGYLIDKNFEMKDLKTLLKQYYLLDEDQKLNYREQAFYTWNTKFNAKKNIDLYYASVLRQEVGEKNEY